MSWVLEDISGVVKKLIIQASASVVSAELQKAYNELKSTINLPGFRKGKAPQQMLEKKFGTQVEAEVVSKLIQSLYEDSLKESSLIPVGQPKVEEQPKLEKDKPFEFTVTIEVIPDLTALKYEGIEIETIELKISDNDVTNELIKLQQSKVSFEPTDDKLTSGDMAVIDYIGFVDEQPIQELEQYGFEFVVGSPALHSELNTALIDRVKDDNFTVDIKIDENNQLQTIAGKTVRFNIDVKEVKKRVEPEIDDDFALDLGYENLETLKESLLETIRKRKENEIKTMYQHQILEKLINSLVIELPPSMFEYELKRVVEEGKKLFMMMRQPIPTDEEMMILQKPHAEKNLKTSFILHAVGNKEDIQISDEMLNQHINQKAKETGTSPESIKKKQIALNGSLDSLREELYVSAVMDCILSKAVFTEKKTVDTSELHQSAKDTATEQQS
jgi:trigger factor